MVTTVGLNPSIDRIVHIERFTYGGMNRVTRRREYPAGKSTNVAVALSALGVDTRSIGFSREENRGALEAHLRRFGVRSEFVYLTGALRTNIKLLDAEKGAVTEINEPGEAIQGDALKRMDEMIRRYAARSDFLIFTGSLPPGCPKDYYRAAIEAAREYPVRCVLDAEGEALHQGILARPFLIKPNRYELEMAAGGPLTTTRELIDAARALVARGAANVAVSMGEMGALFVNERDVYLAEPYDMVVKSTVGAGDAMVAGLVGGFIGGHSADMAFKMGVAAATASVATEDAGKFEPEIYGKILGGISIKRVERV